MLTALVGAGALLLLSAGATKAVDPTRTVGALTALGWAASPAAVRAGAATEAVTGAATLVFGGRVLSGLVGLSYAGFAAFVAVALRSGGPIGSCGCFGRADTLPRRLHVVVDLGLAAAGFAGTVAGVTPLVAAPLPVATGAVALAAGAYVALTAGSTRGPSHEGRVTAG
jgi:hypothetical protein